MNPDLPIHPLTRRYARRLTAAAVVHRIGPFLMGSAVAFGLAALTVRRFAPESVHRIPYLAGLSGIVWIVALVWLARRFAYPRPDAAIVVDRTLKAHGLFLTLEECPDPRWAEFLRWRGETEAMPKPDWGRLVAPTAVAVLFVVAALTVPVGGAEVPATREVGRRLARDLDRQAERLVAGGILDEREAESVTREIGELRRAVEARGLTAREWEAADAIRRRLEGLAAHGLGDLTQATSLLQSAGAGGLNDLAALAPMLPMVFQALSLAGRLGLDPSELAALRNGLANGTLDPRLAEKLTGLAPKVLELLDSEDVAELARDAGLSEDVLKELRAKGRRALEGSGLGGGSAASSKGNGPRGFGGETRLHRERFAPGRLPSGTEPGTPLGAMVENPTVAPDYSFSPTEAREFERTESERTARQRLRPLHRGLIRRYFAPKDATPRD